MKTVRNSLLGKNSYLVMGFCMMIFNLSALSVGDVAPDFSLPDQDNKIHSLNEFKGRYIVLYFYPKDDTPGCTKEACLLRDDFSEFEKQNIVVLGINYDSPSSHKNFKEKYHLPFILLSDSKKAVAKKYGAKNWWFIPVPYRMTFIINPEGKICSILHNIDISTHAATVLKIIKQ